MSEAATSDGTEPVRVQAQALQGPQGRRIRASEPKYLEVLDFLWEEAATLDRHDLLQWKAMLDREVRYRMPVCVTRRRGTGESYETEAVHFDEDYLSLSFRIRRIEETLAWAMDPTPRIRRFVTSVRLWETDEPAIYDVASSLLLIRTSEDDYRTDLITAERTDRLRALSDGTFLLRERKIVADQSTIGTHNLAMFL